MKKHWKTAAALTLVVLLSGLVGALGGAKYATEKARRRSNPEAWNVSAMRTLERRLTLSPEQQVRIQTIMDGGVGELKVLRLETIDRTNRVLDRLVAELEKELKPEQLVEFAKLRAERKSATLDMLNVEPERKP